MLFISLHHVVIRVADANASDYRNSANELLTLIENESDFPTWYRYKSGRPKSKGEVDMTLGPPRGKRLLEHAARSGEPVEYDPTFDYGHDFYEKPSPPELIYEFIRGDDTIFGFQIAEIEPFLARHGLRGFDSADGFKGKDEGLPDKVSARGIQKQRAQELAILAALNVRGLDPLSMERAPKGNKPWPLRVGISVDLKLSKEVIKKAWTRLRGDGRIRDA